VGPASGWDDAGAIRSAGSGEESGACGDAGGSGSASENAARSGACSNVASGTTVFELLGLAEEALIALDAGEIDLAKKILRAFRRGCSRGLGRRGWMRPADRAMSLGSHAGARPWRLVSMDLRTER
jgi:hypothetical protein